MLFYWSKRANEKLRNISAEQKGIQGHATSMKMTTYSGRCEDDDVDRFTTKWKHLKMKIYTPRKADSVISESGYSSSSSNNSKDSFHQTTIPSTSHLLHSPSIQDSDTDEGGGSNIDFKTTQISSDKEFPTETSKNQHDSQSTTTPDVKQLDSNNCFKLNTDQCTSLQSSTNHQLKTSAHIKLNRLPAGEDEQRKQKRFNRTAKALRDSGLLPIAIQTGHLLKKNLFLQKEIDKLKKETELFLQSLNSEENVSENTTASDSSSSD